MTYVEGFVTAVPTANREAYLDHARTAGEFIRECGATRMVEAWGDDVPRGTLTDFYGAVQAKEDETVLFSWFEYPDRTTRDAATQRMMADPRMEQMARDMPFDGSRMIYGGFAAIADTGPARGGYIDGIILAVPDANKDAYHALSVRMAALLRDYGALRSIDGWGDDVPDGKVTDFRRAVRAQAGETVVYSWLEWADKATRDAGWASAMADERMESGGERPFDGKRMVWGGFVPILDI